MPNLNVVSPLPEWVLDTFEGRFLDAWIGCVPHGGDHVRFSGNTDLRQNGFDTVLKLHDIGLADLVVLCEESNTPLANLAVRLLTDRKTLAAMFSNQDEINLRVFVAWAGDLGQGGPHRPITVEDFLFSLVSRYPDDMPFIETADAQGAKLITPLGIEPIQNPKAMRRRKSELGSSQTPSSQTPGDEHDYWNKTSIAVEVLEIVASVTRILGR